MGKPVKDQAHKGPVFIIGSQRSGTTMLRLMLNAHPNLSVPFESNFIVETYKALANYGDLSSKYNIRQLLDDISEDTFVKRGLLIEDKETILEAAPKTYAELIEAIYSVYARKRGKIRWGDKDPSYVTDIDVLYKLFPNCSVVHIVRDGRDVAGSLKNLDWGSKNLQKLARDWQWQVILAHKMGAMLGDQYFEVMYEDLVREPKIYLQKICIFIGEEFSDEMLNYHKEARSEIPTDSIKYHESSVSPPNVDKVQMWKRKMTKAELIIFEQVAGETLSLFGYETLNEVPTLAVKLKNLWYNLFMRW